MFDFNNINKVIEGKAMTDTTPIIRLDDETTQKVFNTAYKMGMSDKLTTIMKNLISKMGIIKDKNNETVAVNAVCFFTSPVKGIGALLDDPEFRIFELDVSGANITLTDYIAGGVIRRDRDIMTYNKTRQFHKDNIECIIPLNNRGVDEYGAAPQYILNIGSDHKPITVADTGIDDVSAAKIAVDPVNYNPNEMLVLTGNSNSIGFVRGDVSSSVTSDNSPWSAGKTPTDSMDTTLDKIIDTVQEIVEEPAPIRKSHC